MCQSESAGEGRDKKLCSELQFGNTCTSKGKDDLKLIVHKYNDEVQTIQWSSSVYHLMLSQCI